MDYLLSKHTFDLLLSVLPIIWSVVLILLIIYRKKASLVYVIISTIIVWTIATPAFSSFLMSGLERKFPPVPAAYSPTADAIVVLGGSLKTRTSPTQDISLSESSNRILHAARLYRYSKAKVVIACGGAEQYEPEAYAIRELLTEWGVPPVSILIETKSLNTYQNAVNIIPILEAHKFKNILLVTSAMHMPRALRTFRTASIDAIPSPTDYNDSATSERTLIDFLPDVEAFHGTLKTSKEYAGILVYRWKGWIRNES